MFSTFFSPKCTHKLSMTFENKVPKRFLTKFDKIQIPGGSPKTALRGPELDFGVQVGVPSVILHEFMDKKEKYVFLTFVVKKFIPKQADFVWWKSRDQT